MIVKKLIQKHQPTVVIVCGSWGKSMAISTAKVVLEAAGKSVAINYDTKSLRDDLLNPGRKPSILRGLSALWMKGQYPEIIFAELHEESRISKELLGLIARKVLLIPYISQRDLLATGSVEKYLARNCSITKKTINDFQIVYNKDVKGLEEGLESQGGENMFGYTTSDSEAVFKSMGVEFKLREDAVISNDHRVQGIYFKVKNGGSTLPLRINGGIGNQHVYPVLSALTLSKIIGENIVDSLNVIRDAKVLPGRLTLIPGIKKTLLVDDTYDIDAETALETFELGARIPLEEGQRKVAVVGEMLEYGNDSAKVHELLGAELAGLGYDALVGIGERAHDLLKGATDAGMDPSQIFHYTDQVEAGKFIQHELKQGDLVVIKGSKASKLESVVKELMAFPLKAKEDLLLR